MKTNDEGMPLPREGKSEDLCIRLKKFTDNLVMNRPLEVTTVKHIETPDGPMHTHTKEIHHPRPVFDRSSQEIHIGDMVAGDALTGERIAGCVGAFRREDGGDLLVLVCVKIYPPPSFVAPERVKQNTQTCRMQLHASQKTCKGAGVKVECSTHLGRASEFDIMVLA